MRIYHIILGDNAPPDYAQTLCARLTPTARLSVGLWDPPPPGAGKTLRLCKRCRWGQELLKAGYPDLYGACPEHPEPPPKEAATP